MENGVLRMVVEHAPSPIQAQKYRYKKYCPLLDSPNPSEDLKIIKNAIIFYRNCIQTDSTIFAYRLLTLFMKSWAVVIFH